MYKNSILKLVRRMPKEQQPVTALILILMRLNCVNKDFSIGTDEIEEYCQRLTK